MAWLIVTIPPFCVKVVLGWIGGIGFNNRSFAAFTERYFALSDPASMPDLMSLDMSVLFLRLTFAFPDRCMPLVMCRFVFCEAVRLPEILMKSWMMPDPMMDWFWFMVRSVPRMWTAFCEVIDLKFVFAA